MVLLDSGSQWPLSSDGTTLVAGQFYATDDYRLGQIYVSKDSGATWQSRGPAGHWGAVALSGDGKTLIAAQYAADFANAHAANPVLDTPGHIYLSKDSGSTWRSSGPAGFWSGVASSSDGSTLVAAQYSNVTGSGQLYVSTDAGSTWIPSPTPVGNFYGVASSSDGMQLCAAQSASATGNLGQLYIGINKK